MASRLEDCLSYMVAGWIIACVVLGSIWMVMFSIDMVHQLMRVCR
jgi:hypothetical protein